MTRKEAIELLDDRMCFGRGKWSEHHEPEIDEYWQAGQMAIEALRNKNDLPISPLLKDPKQPENGSKQFGNTEKLGDGITGEICTDAISRAAVVDMLDEIEAEVADGYGFQYGKWRKWACELPSAQPDLSEYSDKLWRAAYERGKKEAQSEIIRCKDCKHLQKWRSEESAKRFGQIYECARNVFDCPKPEDFCSRGERKNDGTEQP